MHNVTHYISDNIITYYILIILKFKKFEKIWDLNFEIYFFKYLHL